MCIRDRRSAAYVAYYALGTHLPRSYAPGGALAAKLRSAAGQRMLESAGEGINIEHGAVSYTHLDVYKRQEQKCAVSTVTKLEEALLATGFPYDRKTSDDDNLHSFATLKKRAQGIRRCGSAAIDLCLVADGTYDGYWERKLMPLSLIHI